MSLLTTTDVGSIETACALAGPARPPVLARSNVARWNGRAFLGPLILTIVFGTLLRWTWGRWLDPVIDFGRELYVPSQLAAGKVLGVNIVSFYGPLSPAFNALCFRLFGATLLTLVTVNAVILAIATGLLYAIVLEIGSRLAATVSGIVFLTIFGMGHLLGVGNFNFITPYSHEATHGFTLCLLCLYCYMRWMRGRSGRWIIAMGVCMGLVFLTKPEFFVALAVSLFVGVGGALWKDRTAEPAWRTIGLLICSNLAPVLISLVFIMRLMPWEVAWRDVFGSWLFLGNAGVTQSFYYASHMGMDDPGLHFSQAGQMVASLLALLTPALLMSLIVRSGGRRMRMLWAFVGAGFVLGMAVMLGKWPVGIAVGSSVLLLMPLLFSWQVGRLFLSRRGADDANTRWLRVTLILFACVLLLKLGLYTRFDHYGFVLAGPAATLLIVAGLDWIPAWIEKHGRSGAMWRGGMLAIIAGVVWMHLTLSAGYMNGKQYPLGDGKNAFMTDDRAAVFIDTLAFLRHNSTPGQTLTVLPEGAMLNVLSQRASASRYISFIPSDVAMFGERTLLESLVQGRPDFLAILDRPTASFGPRNFGIDYAQCIREWAMRNYVPVHLAGAAPFSGQGFGILLLRRKDLPSGAH